MFYNIFATPVFLFGAVGNKDLGHRT